MTTLKQALGLEPNESPFPWQDELLARFLAGIDNRMSLDIPTGLGKTSVMAAWLVAKAEGANLPRRLVYIVDRRAVVDQATSEAERLRGWVAETQDVRRHLELPDGGPLPISTLRGQFADNREWLSDPTLPAIIVGTVDMIGSRLLFEGYGVSRKMRPYHAGFLGSDTLFVLDEAHLVPPFEALLNRVVDRETDLCGSAEVADVVPRSILLSLSATGRGSCEDVLRISKKDLQHEIAGQRLRATKRLRFVEQVNDDEDIADRLAAHAWDLTEQGTANRRIIVFCNSRTTAMKAKQAVAERAKGDKKQDIPERRIVSQLFVGARRVRERQGAAAWLEDHGFLASTQSSCETPAFVFATSAGEVGVDLDAEHMVSDLVTFERMVQRLGRVNRRGEGDAEIRVLVERDQPSKKESTELNKALEKPVRQRGAKDHALVRQFDLAPKYRAALDALPATDGEGARNASPEALRQLKISSAEDQRLDDMLSAATTPAPLRPELSRPILDSWSMTSLETHSARPFVAPWLRGWVEDQPQTTVVWRQYLPTRSTQCTKAQIEEFFEAAPIHLTEKLETNSDEVFKWLLKRAERVLKLKANPKRTAPEDLQRLPRDEDVVAVLLDHSGNMVRTLTLHELQFEGDKKVQNDRKRFVRQLENHTLVVDARLGGLTAGLLVDKAAETEFAAAADAMPATEWMPSNGPNQADPIPAFRILEQSVEDPTEDAEKQKADSQWKTCYRLPIQSPGEDEPSRFLIVQKFCKTVTSEESRSTIGLRSLDLHLKDTEEVACELARRLDLPPNLQLALRIAARNHDHGKDCERWQNAFSAPEDGRPYAKTAGPFRNSLLDGYRHEFASLPFVQRDPDFAGLSDDLKDLTLHLVAAHHGFARPVIRTHGCEDAPPSALDGRARDAALRFARLQARWGPWGLAWLESILRAADHRASAKVDDAAPAESDEQRTAEEVSHA